MSIKRLNIFYLPQILIKIHIARTVLKKTILVSLSKRKQSKLEDVLKRKQSKLEDILKRNQSKLEGVLHLNLFQI